MTAISVNGPYSISIAQCILVDGQQLCKLVIICQTKYPVIIKYTYLHVCTLTLFVLHMPTRIYPVMWRGWINQASGYTYIPYSYPSIASNSERTSPGKRSTLSKHRPMTSSTGVALEIIRPSRNKKTRKQKSRARGHILLVRLGKKFSHSRINVSGPSCECRDQLPRMGVRGTCHVRAKEVVSTVTCKGQDLGLCMSKYATCPTLPKPLATYGRRGFQTACKRLQGRRVP